MRRSHIAASLARPDLGRALVGGAWAGAWIWAAEVAAVAALNADVGGLAVLAALGGPLARWGLGYLAAGAALGAPAARLGWTVVPLGWLGIVAVGDPGVAPRAIGGAVAAGALLAAAGAWRIVPERRRTQGLLGLSLALGLGAVPRPGPSEPRGEPDAGPDVVVVVVDALRADHVGAWGYARPTTPTIDALAAEGLRFGAARATASWTLPSHASLFTGELPSVHRAHAGDPILGPGVPTLAELLDARGYRTVGLSANAWVSAGTGLDRGFERFRFLGADGIVSQMLLPLALTAPEDLGGRAIADAAVEEIRSAAAADERLFLFVNLLEAHEPLGTLPEPALSRFASAPLDPSVGRVWIRDMPRFWCACAADAGELACRDGLYRAPPDRIREAVDRYDAGVAYADARIAELRQALIDAGRWEHTVFVVTSDHGEHLGEEGRMGHMVWLDDPLVAIPLVVRYPPRLAAGSVDAAPIDLAGFHRWLRALIEGRSELPRTAEATSESQPHPEALRARWSALFGCDFAPAGLARHRRESADGVTTSEALRPEGVDGRALAPETRASLRSLGYVE